MFEAAPLVVEAPPDESVLTDAARSAAEQWGLPVPELIRIGANGVFLSGDTILRVGVVTAPIGTALAFAERLSAAGISVARPARPDWLEFAGGLAVSAWKPIDFDPDAPVDWQRVGQMVASVHDIDPTTVDHPLPFCGDFPWWDFSTVSVETDDDPDAAHVLRSVEERSRWWYDSARSGEMVLLHGDVHPGNVLVTRSGPVLIDWDLLCIGPREWDHAPLMTWTDRWGGAAGIYEAFAAGYARPIDRAMADALAERRLLAATLMRRRRARLDPVHRPEADRRMQYWRGDPDAPLWTAQ